MMIRFTKKTKYLSNRIQMLLSDHRKPLKKQPPKIPLRTPQDVQKQIQSDQLFQYSKVMKQPNQPIQEQQKKQDKEDKQKSFNSQNQANWMKYAGIGALAYFIFFNREIESNYIDEHELWQQEGIQKIRVKYKNEELIAIIEGKKLKCKIKNLDSFMKRLENYGGINVEFDYESLENQKKNNLSPLINMLVLGLIGYWIYLSYTFYKKNIKSGKGLNLGGDMFGFGKIKNIQIDGEMQKIKFKDVAGQNEAKQEISEFVDFLKNPQKDLGARLPRGALLTGPPGTGKTLLAKACAGESEVPFFYLSGSDFVEMFVGVGASRVRDLFKQAKSKQPSIIFIDEIDAIGRKRESKLGGNDERDSTLNQLLVEMDGFGTNQNVIVMAATNRSELLDPALTRPGRFDRSIEVTLPDLEGRKQILSLHLSPLTLDPKLPLDICAKRLATLTPGFSGAELANLCNEGAIQAAREKSQSVKAKHFEMASERITAGLPIPVKDQNQQITVAYHEAGHAVTSYFLSTGNPLVKITIIPRSKGALGYAQYLPKESSLQTKQALMEQISVILGGRVSEDIKFKEITTGASDDLDKAYNIARAMIQNLGMGDLGYIAFNSEQQLVTPHSEFIQSKIDQEVKNLIDEAEALTYKTLNENWDKVCDLAENLIKKESLEIAEIREILGPRKQESEEYKDYLEVKGEIEKEIQEDEEQSSEFKEQNIKTEKELA